MNKRRVINNIGRAAQLIGIKFPHIDPAKLIALVKKEYDVSDEYNTDYEIALSKLVEEATANPKLTTFGRYALRNDIINLLHGRFALQKHQNTHPNNYTNNITDPLVIIGLPRTGTTILHSLLALDSEFRAPLVWEFNLAPEPPKANHVDNATRIARTQNEIESFKNMVPEMEQIHLYDATLPQECIMATAMDFNSMYFEVKYQIPNFQEWYKSSDKKETYLFHKRVLQYLQANVPTEKWLLKTPAFIGELPELLSTYPNAKIIHTHRDVKHVLQSVASLYYTLRGAFHRDIDVEELGEEMIHVWHERLEKCLTFREENSQYSNQFFDLDFSNFMNDTIGSIKLIYEHFGLNLSEDTENKMKAFLLNNKRTKTKKVVNVNFGFEEKEEMINQKFRKYQETYIKSSNNYE